MGKRQKQLARLLGNESVTYPAPKRRDIAKSAYEKAVQELYIKLGGIQETYPLNLRTWDMQFSGVAVELDEEQHFHRYRAQTLASHIYKELPNFPFSVYQTYCSKRENKARTDGGFWTNPSCDKQFGIANARGDLTGNGASRWKQRAFYDFVKDLSPLILGFNVVRVAIWDTVSVAGRQMTVENALEYVDGKVRDAFIELIEQRSYETFPPN